MRNKRQKQQKLIEVKLKGCDLRSQTPGGGVLPHMGYIGMCHCEGYGFEAVYSTIAFGSGIGYHFSGK